MTALLESVGFSLLSASVLVLVALGFQVVFRTSGFFYFAYAGVIAVGPYATWSLHRLLGWPLWLSISGAVTATVVVGFSCNLIHRQVRRSRGSSSVHLLCSLGLLIVIQSSISALFGSDIKSLRSWPVREAWDLAGIRLTTIQLATVVTAAAVITLLWCFMRFTSLGHQMDALADNEELARVLGIQTERIHAVAIVVSSLVGAVAGIIVSLDVDMSPNMGLMPLMMGVVAVILGGGSFWGTVAGAAVLGAARHLVVMWLPSQWQEVIVLVIVLIILTIRPTGFAARPA